jgi:hypothetical protein
MHCLHNIPDVPSCVKRNLSCVCDSVSNASGCAKWLGKTDRSINSTSQLIRGL